MSFKQWTKVWYAHVMGLLLLSNKQEQTNDADNLKET